MASDRDQAYHSASHLVRLMTIFFALYAFLGLVASWSGWLEIQLLNEMGAGATVTDAEVDANDVRQGLVGLGQLIIFLTLVVMFSIWIHRANRNARALGAERMQFTPGWCVGWFFVPIMNLFRPYQAVKEIWKASDPDWQQGREPVFHVGLDGVDAPWQRADTPSVLGVWWGLWIVSGALGQASFRLSLRAEEVEELLTASWMTLASDILDLPLVLAVILVVRGINERQELRRTQVL